MDTALEILPADYWRYYLIANAPESADSNFTWEHFAERGEQGPRRRAGQFRQPRDEILARRASTARCPAGGAYGEDEQALIAELDRRVAQYTEHMEAMEFRKALGELRAIWVAGNEYLTRAAPWTHDQDRPGPRRGQRAHGAQPGASVRASVVAGHPERGPDHPQRGDGRAGDHSVAGRADGRVSRWSRAGRSRSRRRPVLFAKITDEQVAEWEARFGGAEKSS